MDPKNETLPSETQTNSALNITAVQSFISKNIKIVAIGVIGLLIVVALVIWFMMRDQIQNKPVLQIGDETINNQEFDSAYNFYKSGADETNTEDEIRDFTKKLFIEQYILKKEYLSQGNTLEQLAEKSVQVDPGLTVDMPESVAQSYREIFVMKKAIYPNIGVKSRTGVAYWYASSLVDSSPQQQSIERFVQQRLETLKNNIQSSGPTEQLKNNFINDSSVKQRQGLTAEVREFTGMRPSMPIIVHDDFVNKVFSIDVNGVSDVFIAKFRNQIIYGIAYVSEIQDGNYDDYKDWLAEKQDALKIEEIQ